MRLIDADELKQLRWKVISGKIKVNTEYDMVDLCPTIEAEPVRHGHNENKEYHEADEFRCSECGLHLEDWTRYVYDENSNEEYVQEYVFKRCPECGAKIGD